jgi:hypothetical protein
VDLTVPLEERRQKVLLLETEKSIPRTREHDLLTHSQGEGDFAGVLFKTREHKSKWERNFNELEMTLHVIQHSKSRGGARPSKDWLHARLRFRDHSVPAEDANS